MFAWIKNQLNGVKEKLVGKYLRDAVEKGVAALCGVLAAIGLGLDPEMLLRWTTDTTIIVTAGVLYLLNQWFGWSKK